MNTRINYLKQKANRLPQKPGIYLMKDAQSDILYIGKAKQLKQRVSSYFRKNSQHTNKVLRLVHNVVDFETIVVDTEFDALLLECQLIQQHRPIYNRQMTNFLNYEYITIESGKIMRINTPTEAALGPFRLSKQLPEIIETLRETYQLPTVNPYKLLSLAKQLPLMKTMPLKEKNQELQLFFLGESELTFRYIDQRLNYFAEHLLFEQADQLLRQKKLLQSFYREVRGVNTLVNLPEVRFEIPIDPQTIGELPQVKVYQLSFGRIIHSEVVTSREDFIPAPLTQARPLQSADLDPLHIVLRQLRLDLTRSEVRL